MRRSSTGSTLTPIFGVAPPLPTKIFGFRLWGRTMHGYGCPLETGDFGLRVDLVDVRARPSRTVDGRQGNRAGAVRSGQAVGRVGQGRRRLPEVRREPTPRPG